MLRHLLTIKTLIIFQAGCHQNHFEHIVRAHRLLTSHKKIKTFSMDLTNSLLLFSHAKEVSLTQFYSILTMLKWHLRFFEIWCNTSRICNFIISWILLKHRSISFALAKTTFASDEFKYISKASANDCFRTEINVSASKYR